MLLERSSKIAKEMADGTIIFDHLRMAVNSGRYQEIHDLLEMSFKELMGE